MVATVACGQDDACEGDAMRNSKRQTVKSALSLVGAFVFAAGMLVNVQVAEGGTISYPAMGNVELPQGTIEMWITPQFDPIDSDLAKKDYWGFNLVQIYQDDDNFICLIWRSIKGRRGPFARHRQQGFRIPTNFSTISGWKKDEPHHIAYCWEGETDWWVIDGKKTNESSSKYGPLKLHMNESMTIELGTAKVNEKFVIDDLRISSIARKEDEVGYHNPGKLGNDAWTLLLDTFDEPFECDGTTQTSPVIMTPSVSGQSGGIPDKNCKFVPGVSKSALSL